MPKRVGGGGGGRRPAAARPKMVSQSKAKGIGGVVGGGGGGGASRGLEEAPAPAPSPEAAAPSQPRPSGAKPFMKGLVGFFKQKLSRKPKPDAPASTLEMPDLSRASLRAEMGEARRGPRKELSEDAPQSRRGPRLAAALSADIDGHEDVEMSPEAEALFEQARQAAIRARMMSLALVAAVGVAGIALWDRIFPAIPTDQGADANLSKFFEDRAYDDEGVDAEGNPLSDELLSEAQQEVRQSRDLGPDTVDLLGYIDLKAKVAGVAKANQMADRVS